MSTKRRSLARASRSPAKGSRSSAASADALPNAYAAAMASFGHRPYVTGIDVGYRVKDSRVTESICVRLHVSDKLAEELLEPREVFPKRLAGVPVDVIQTTYRNHGDTPPASLSERRQRFADLRAGISIGALGGPSGTLGALLIDKRSLEPCVLTAAHVFAHPGRVLQPSARDDGTDPESNAFGKYRRMDPETDAAIAGIDMQPATRGLELSAYGSLKVFKAPRAARLGDILEKSGRTTGITRGRVTGIGFFGGLLDTLYIAPLDDAQDRTLALRGDSGAVWYDAAEEAMVGLHLRGPFAPSRVNEFAIASQLTKVFENLELEIIQ